MTIFAPLIITNLQRKCKNNAEKFGFWTILYYLCTRFHKFIGWVVDIGNGIELLSWHNCRLLV